MDSRLVMAKYKGTKAVLLRLSDDDHNWLNEESEKNRMSMSGFLRHFAITLRKKHNSKIKKLNRKLEKLNKL